MFTSTGPTPVFWTILELELAYLFRRATTCLYFVVLLGMAFYTMASDLIQTEGGIGGVYRNAPATIAEVMAALTLISQVITTGIVGTAILRDVQLKAHELVFTTRATRMGYLGGRFTGALIVMVAIYAAIPVGTFLGTLMPWVDHATLQPFQFASYVRPFLVVVLPDVFFISALFFAIGAFTRNLFAVYAQGVALFVAYAISHQVFRGLGQARLGAWTDPFGIAALNLSTRYWTIVERNTRPITLSGPLLTNRLIWLVVTAAIMIAAFALVRLEVTPIASMRLRRRREPPQPIVLATRKVPAVSLSFGVRARWSQLIGEAWFSFVAIVREPVFQVIACISVAVVCLGAWDAGRENGTTVWPVTGQMLAVLIDGQYVMLAILITIYAGELVWRERQLRVAGTTDVLPVPSGIVMGGKFTALLGASMLVEGLAVLGAIAVQTLAGYHAYEWGLYARGMVGIALPLVIEVSALAFFVHAVVNEKFVGHLIMIAYVVVTQTSAPLGLERVMYQYGFSPQYVYSDMNHFALYASFLTGLAGYGLALAFAILVGTYLAWTRGAEDTRRARRLAAVERWRAPVTRVVGGAAALALATTGAVVWYNTAVLNPFASSTQVERRRAAYERAFRGFRQLAAPRIIEVHVRADLVPERSTFALASVYRMVNRETRPLDTLFVSVASVAFAGGALGGMTAAHGYRVDSLKWSAPASLLFADTARGVYLYRLAHRLGAGDTITLAFGAHYAARGYPNDHPNSDIVANGTFIDAVTNGTLLNTSYFPSLVYDAGVELADGDERRRQHLPPRDRTPSIHDTSARRNSILSTDADWVTFDAVVSTAPDQIAIAPGTLKREWMEHGRRVFEYAFDHPIPNSFSIQSGRYALRRDSANGVAIEVYYHPDHAFDVERMIEGAKRGLAYYETHFSAYQYRQFRIVEFPRYHGVAVALPGTVAYSEGLGFIARVRDADDDLDWPLFVTAHELAHQWWDNQVTPAFQQGWTMLDESLAEYSALTVMEKKYGSVAARKFLRYELDGYLAGRSHERQREVPLMLVEGIPQLYIAYNKGSLAFYALRDYIGEDSLNVALHRFLHDKAFQPPPYPNTMELLDYLRAVTPDSLRYVIHDLFETITLYDNKATAATAMRRPDGTYLVHVAFDAHKLRADSVGAESEIPIADYIDVGVFGAPDRGNALGHPLAVRKVYVTRQHMAVDFVVSELPRNAGIDPFNKLIDRTPEDNVRAVDVRGTSLDRERE